MECPRCGGFQSLSGVLDVCNCSRGQRPGALFSRFQSLSGVLDVCNYEDLKALGDIKKMFQSLSGVLDVCNFMRVASQNRLSVHVSIPFRGFRCLQRSCQPATHEKISSFNPFQGF